eukprot:1486262-Rhodomonas_salina.1
MPSDLATGERQQGQHSRNRLPGAKPQPEPEPEVKDADAHREDRQCRGKPASKRTAFALGV